MRNLSILVLFITCIFVGACVDKGSELSNFSLLHNEDIGIDFSNDLIYDKDFNVYRYRNFYNGGGVAIGDINNDGLQDIYLTANQDSNRLYLNIGDFKFKDITSSSNTAGNRAWSTGVTMVDINADGFLDIYVCNSGDLEGDDKESELFINNGDNTFTEKAAHYNLNDSGYSTHAAFFDYDKDGDLDVYLLNNSYQAIGSFNLKKNERPIRNVEGGDKFLKNEDGKFIDVSEEAGIYGSVIGFGLGVVVADVNNDGWEDIFISNDFFERDYLYINQQNGTFKEDLTNQMTSISGASMGADIADIDNNGFPEIFVTEMLPYEEERLKTVTTFESWDKYFYNVQNGYHHQFTRNTLHYNNGNNSFSEISRFANVDASDWSWGALFFDMDNDGYKDLFVANGIYRDLTNQDYLQYVANEEVVKSIVSGDGVNYRELIDMIPSNKVANRSFRNNGKLGFDDYKDSGLNIESFSNGAAYGDLDNDGDLDLVVNNVNMPVFIFRNNADSKKNNYLKLILEGQGKNKFGIGAKVNVTAGGERYTMEIQPSRGFQSSVDIRPNIGLGKIRTVDVEVIWSSGGVSYLKDVAANQIVTVQEATSIRSLEENKKLSKKFTEIKPLVKYLHHESPYSDFNRERLLYHMISNEGPRISVGDVNGDQRDDLVIPGAKGFDSKIYLASDTGFVASKMLNEIAKYTSSEHVASELFDADNDGDLDIYFASGSVEVTPFSELLFDVLYINNGQEGFSPSPQRFPNSSQNISTGTVAHFDYDLDGDYDLFVGERSKIGRYGAPGSGFILENDGNANFQDVTADVAPELANLGMMTDSKILDIDNDGDVDLIVVGEFMPITIFLNENGTFRKNVPDDLNLKGWWKVIHDVDIDGDGDIDFIIGNHGLNSRFKANRKHPIKLFYNDFDKNGFYEGVLTFNASDGKDYPYALRHNLIDQIKELKRKFPDFESYKNADIKNIFSQEQLEESFVSEVNTLESVIMINKGNLKFDKIVLPNGAQMSPIYAIETADFDQDGDIDIVVGGNLFRVQPEMGIYDALKGLYIENSSNLKFVHYPDGQGLYTEGEIRDFQIINNELLVVRNSASIQTFQYNP